MTKHVSLIEIIANEICRSFKFFCVDDNHNIVLQNDETGEVLLLTKDFEYHSDEVKKLYEYIDSKAVDKKSAINAKLAYQRAICQRLENHFIKDVMIMFGVIS